MTDTAGYRAARSTSGSWTLAGTELRVDDLVGGTGEHSVTVRWHLAPGAAVRLGDGEAAVHTPGGDFRVGVTASHPVALAAEYAPLAIGFGRTVDAPVLVCRTKAELPMRISTAWHRAGDFQLMSAGEPAFAFKGVHVKQIVQPLGGGPVEVLDVPRPVPDATEVLVRTVASVISPGTERAVTALAQANLLAKARARPDLVRQVVKKARTEGLAATRQAVRGRLAEDLPLGYSAAGIVLATGPAVTGVRPGQLVATGGAGKANHAELQAVPGLLCATVPGGVSAEDAAFTTIASIALHGLRQAEAGPDQRSWSSA